MTDSHVRDIAVNTLLLISTTVDRMHEVRPRVCAWGGAGAGAHSPARLPSRFSLWAPPCRSCFPVCSGPGHRSARAWKVQPRWVATQTSEPCAVGSGLGRGSAWALFQHPPAGPRANAACLGTAGVPVGCVAGWGLFFWPNAVPWVCRRVGDAAVLPCPAQASPQVLWPRLLAFVTPVHLSNALTPLCKSLVHLAAKRQEEEEGPFQLQYEANGGFPRLAAGPGAAGRAGVLRPLLAGCGGLTVLASGRVVPMGVGGWVGGTQGLQWLAGWLAGCGLSIPAGGL